MSTDTTLAQITAGVEKSLLSCSFLPKGRGLLLALSGGADSVTLLLALLQLSEDNLEVSQMTDEQLQVEKLRLLQLLNICDGANNQQTAEESPDEN